MNTLSSIAQSGMNSAVLHLDAAAHNIANAQTPDFRRQRVVDQTQVGGGVATVREYLRAGLVDEMHLAITPAVLGAGEALLAGIDLRRLGFEPSRHVGTAGAMHVVLTRGG